CAYRITVVMHDCTHATLFVRRSTNRIVGSLLGAMTGIDFASFSKLHWQHHRTVGTTDDPQRFHYAGIETMTSREFVVHLLKPLLGLNLKYTFSESVLAPANALRMVRTGEWAVVAIVQAAILTLVTGFGRHPALALLPAISASTFGLFLSQLRGVAE